MNLPFTPKIVYLDCLSGYCDEKEVEIQASYSGITHYCKDTIISQDIISARRGLEGLLNSLRKKIWKATKEMPNTESELFNFYAFETELMETFRTGKFGLSLERKKRKKYGGRIRETHLFRFPGDKKEKPREIPLSLFYNDNNEISDEIRDRKREIVLETYQEFLEGFKRFRNEEVMTL